MQYILFGHPFQDFIGSPVPLTPHSAALHVGLKSLALSGLLRRIGTIVPQELIPYKDKYSNINEYQVIYKQKSAPFLRLQLVLGGT
ncbi:hypothetical protein Barb6_02107 [Bacteroidales bacterium Barb6]|nr:hypothetical protein Barb6_02107 [Bacteroidales bacterium Barb6]